MTGLTTNAIPCFLGQHCAVVCNAGEVETIMVDGGDATK